MEPRCRRNRSARHGRPDGPPDVFGARGTAPGQFDFVPGLSVDPAREHDVFVADDRNNRIQRFNAGGAFEALVGTLGSGPGQLDNPYDTAVDLAGRLFVADNQEPPRRALRRHQSHVRDEFRRGGRAARPAKQRPRHRRGPGADAAGGVFATNTSLNQVSEFGADGAFIRRWGGDGRGPGAYMQPREVAVEPNGDIVLADTRADRVQVLRASGHVDTWSRISVALGVPTSGGRPGVSATRPAWPWTRATGTSGSWRAAATACSASLRASSSRPLSPTAALRVAWRSQSASPNVATYGKLDWCTAECSA